MRRRVLLIAAVLAAMFPGVGQAATPVAVAAGPDFAVARQPQVAVGPGGAVHVAFGVGNAVYCTTSSDNGKTFVAPVKVSDSGVLALGKRRGPRIAATNGALVVAAVSGQRGGGKDGDLVVWRSTDGGRSWSLGVTVNRVPGSAREGLHDLTAGPDGQLFCVWLDLRNGKSQVFGSMSSNDGATWGEDRLVYESPTGGVCPCCQPSACFDSLGRVHVLWRNNIGDDRDMYLVTSADGGRAWAAPRKLGSGTWHLRACPMDGGGLASDSDGTVQTIWRRNQTIYRCVDAGPEVSLGTGEQGRAARGPDGVYLTWIAQRPGSLFVLPPKRSEPMQLSSRAADPAIAARPDGRGPLVVVWEEFDATAGGPIRAQVITP